MACWNFCSKKIKKKNKCDVKLPCIYLFISMLMCLDFDTTISGKKKCFKFNYAMNSKIDKFFFAYYFKCISCIFCKKKKNVHFKQFLEKRMHNSFLKVF